MKDTNIHNASVNTSPIGTKYVIYNQNTYNIFSHFFSLKIIAGTMLLATATTFFFYEQYKGIPSNLQNKMIAAIKINEQNNKVDIELKRDKSIQNAKTGNRGEARNNILSHSKPTVQTVVGGDESKVENNAEIK